ncbi:MAG: hypothetical protein HZB46_09320 [Solirubrobacterales bacterium]|nr:hypothetical protein [Solirubrobacterales bacterium]
MQLRAGWRRWLVVGALIACAATAAASASDPGVHARDLVAPAEASGPGDRLALAGPWVVSSDPSGQGGPKLFAAGRFPGRLVTVPHVANARGIAGRTALDAHRGGIAWYRTTLTAPDTGSYALRFESVHHKAAVWLDGRLLGHHTGAYLPFEFRLRLRAGVPHSLVVRADFRNPTRMKRAGWHRTWANFGGINREVTLRPIGDSELVAPTLTTRLRADGAAVVDVTVHVRNRGEARDLPVQGSLGGHALDFAPVHVGPGGTGVARARTVVEDPDLWRPGHPALHDLALEVPGEATWKQRVGLRELRRKGSRLYLNGRRLRLHGASLHEDASGRGDGLRPADMDRLVDHLKAIGANATRSQHPLSPALLERLDAAGIVVWLGVGPVDSPGSWESTGPREQRVARARVRESVAQAQLHPSVIAWNLVNEVAGNGHDVTQVRYVRDMARWIHRRDPGRLVAVDVWGAHPPRGALGDLYDDVDAIAVTNYAGWYEQPLAPRRTVARLIRADTRRFVRTFRGKVLVISEFGAEANGENPAGRPGGYAFQSRLLRQHIAAYRAQPAVSGMLVWNLRDFALTPDFNGGSITRLVPGIRLVRGLNQKGLFHLDGRPKPAVAAVRRAYAPLGDGLG